MIRNNVKALREKKIDFNVSKAHLARKIVLIFHDFEDPSLASLARADFMHKYLIFLSGKSIHTGFVLKCHCKDLSCFFNFIIRVAISAFQNTVLHRIVRLDKRRQNRMLNKYPVPFRILAPISHHQPSLLLVSLWWP